MHLDTHILVDFFRGHSNAVDFVNSHTVASMGSSIGLLV
jgi:hypothetical protein